MKVGDLVEVSHSPSSQPGVGIVLEIIYSNDDPPDYRVPGSVLVQFAEVPVARDSRLYDKAGLGPQWYYKGELRIVNAT